jgi:hypothetical protein
MSDTAKLEPKLENKKPTGTATIPFDYAISNKICRLLKKYNIRIIHIPKKENRTDAEVSKGRIKTYDPRRVSDSVRVRKSVRTTRQKDCREEVQRIPEIQTSASNRKVSSGKTMQQHGSLHGYQWHLYSTQNSRISVAPLQYTEHQDT